MQRRAAKNHPFLYTFLFCSLSFVFLYRLKRTYAPEGKQFQRAGFQGLSKIGPIAKYAAPQYVNEQKGCNEKHMLLTFSLEKQESEAWPPSPGAAAAAVSTQPHPESPAPTLCIAQVYLLTKAVKSYQEELHSPNGNELFHHTSLAFDMNLSNNYTPHITFVCGFQGQNSCPLTCLYPALSITLN